MKLKGMWFRVLGLLVMLPVLVACGANNIATPSPSPAAEASPAAPALPEASPESSPEASPDVASPDDEPAVSPEASPAPQASPEASPDATTAQPPAEGGTIRIGSKNFTEQFLLAEMYALVLEANGFEVDRENIGLESEQLAHEALLRGDIDMYPEYMATALQAILGEELPNPPDPEEIYSTVLEQYAELDPPLAVLDPSGFENNQALAMLRSRAEELRILTYSDLSTQTDDLVIGAPPEFFERPDGLRGLQEAYGGFEFRENRQLTPALRYPELEAGNVDVIVAFTTDGQLSEEQFLVLEDDQQLYPPYQVAPVLRQEVLDQYPQIADLLNSVTNALADNETMAALNYAVEGPEAREVEDVAREFLEERGLLQQ